MPRYLRCSSRSGTHGTRQAEAGVADLRTVATKGASPPGVDPPRRSRLVSFPRVFGQSLLPPYWAKAKKWTGCGYAVLDEPLPGTTSVTQGKPGIPEAAS